MVLSTLLTFSLILWLPSFFVDKVVPLVVSLVVVRCAPIPMQSVITFTTFPNLFHLCVISQPLVESHRFRSCEVCPHVLQVFLCLGEGILEMGQMPDACAYYLQVVSQYSRFRSELTHLQDPRSE